MPRPVSDLQRLQRPLRDQVLEFLEKDPLNAFTALEIAARVRASSANGVGLLEMALLMAPKEQLRESLAPWVAALAELEQSGEVKAFPDGDRVYYAYGDAK